MKTIGTVINTIVVVFGMLCSLVAGTFVGYSMAKDEKNRKHEAYRSAYNQYAFTYNEKGKSKDEDF